MTLTSVQPKAFVEYTVAVIIITHEEIRIRAKGTSENIWTLPDFEVEKFEA